MLENAEITTKMISGYPRFEHDRWVENWKFEIVVESKENKLCAFSSLELGNDGNWLGFGSKQKAIAAGRVKLQAMRDINSETYIKSITNESGEIYYAEHTTRKLA